MTPSEVRIARSLLLRRASMATEKVSRTSIMGVVRRFSFYRSTDLAGLRGCETSWPTLGIYISAFPLPSFIQTLKRFARDSVLRIELKRSPVLVDGRLRLALILQQVAQPIVCVPEPGKSAACGRLADIFTEQALRVIQVLVLHDECHTAVKFSSHVLRSDLLTAIGNLQKTVRLVVLNSVVADVIDEIDRFWVAFEC